MLKDEIIGRDKEAEKNLLLLFLGGSLRPFDK